MFKMFLVCVAVLTMSPGFAAAEEPCTAPESVVNLVKLMESIFNGELLKCSDGKDFTVRDKFECKGATYVELFDKTDHPDPKRRRFDVSVVSEESGRVIFTEYQYETEADYIAGKKPRETNVTHPIQASEKTLILYSQDVPKKEDWISSTWFLNVDGKVQGTKVHSEKVVNCLEGSAPQPTRGELLPPSQE